MKPIKRLLVLQERIMSEERRKLEHMMSLMWPVGEGVYVNIRHGQITPTGAIVRGYSGPMLRVTLQTKGKKVISIHFEDVVSS